MRKCNTLRVKTNRQDDRAAIEPPDAHWDRNRKRSKLTGNSQSVKSC